MAIACSTSAFKTDFESALGEVARLGFKHVDLIAIGGWNHVSLPKLVDSFDATADRIEGLLSRYGLTPVAMNFAVHHPHQRTDEQANANRLEQVRAQTRIMNRLGVKVASFYPGYKAEDRRWEDVLADEVATLGEMLAIGRDAGVTLCVEPHFGTPFQSVRQGLGLLEALPELQIAYDPSHYAMQGIDLRETQPLLDRAATVHLRDAGPDKMQRPVGEGTVDFDWIIQTLQARHYAGQWSIEYLPSEEIDIPAQIVALEHLLKRKGL